MNGPSARPNRPGLAFCALDSGVREAEQEAALGLTAQRRPLGEQPGMQHAPVQPRPAPDPHTVDK